MSRVDWHEAERVFQDAMDLPESEREGFVLETCGGRAELLAEVLSLVRAAGDGSTFLERPATDDILESERGAAEPGSLIGQRMGAHEVVRLVGVGGMGTVYEGWRADGQFEQRVAIKVLRADLASPRLLRRFGQERQTLARLEHPGIARLIDGGALADGRPYLVMEFVDGEPIDRYCDGRSLGMRERLRLFLQVAGAVQHAHQNLVIHRDLKPSNILVDGAGNPRVIDFGIALPLYLGSADTMATTARDLLGTLAYMSPEQCERGAGASLDVRSDVYSLGAVLYELLTGVAPHDVGTLSILDAIRVVSREVPARPSLIKAGLRGDLETVMLKGLEHDPGRRYGSVEAFADDVRRFLTNQPIHARPPSRVYAARKFVRRHRLGVAFSLLAVVLVAATAGVAVEQALRAERARASELAQRDRAEWTGYVAAIGAAAESLRSHRPVLAEQWLDSTPEHLRGWEWDHLRSRLDQSERELVGNRSYTTDLALSPDGKMGATVTVRSDILVFETGSGAEVESFPNTQDVADIRFQPGASRAVWADGRPRVNFGDLTSGEVEVMNVEGAEGVTRLAFSPDGSLLALGLSKGGIRVLSMEDDGSVVREMALAQNSYINHLRFSDDGSLLLGSAWKGDNQGKVFLWDVGDWQTRSVIEGPRIIIDSVALSPDASLLATGTIDQRVRIWRTADASGVGYPIACEDIPLGLSFSRDGGSLTIAALGVIRTIDVETGSETSTGHLLADRVAAITYSPDGEQLFAVTNGGRVVTLRSDVQEVSALGAPGVWIFDMALSANGRQVLAQRRLWDAATGELVGWRPRMGTGAARLSPDGSQYLTITSSTIQIRDAVGAEIVREAPVETGTAWAADWHPTRPLIAVGGRSGFPIQLRDSETLETVSVFDGTADGETRVLAFSPDGARLASGTLGSKGLRVWDTETGDLELERAIPGTATWAVAWSPDGRVLAIPGPDRTVLLFDTRTWEELGQLAGHRAVVKDLAFHPSGELLASCGDDQSVRLWNIERRSQVLALFGHRGRVRCLEWSRDGEMLASGDEAGVIRLWNRH